MTGLMRLGHKPLLGSLGMLALRTLLSQNTPSWKLGLCYEKHMSHRWPCIGTLVDIPIWVCTWRQHHWTAM